MPRLFLIRLQYRGERVLLVKSSNRRAGCLLLFRRRDCPFFKRQDHSLRACPIMAFAVKRAMSHLKERSFQDAKKKIDTDISVFAAPPQMAAEEIFLPKNAFGSQSVCEKKTRIPVSAYGL